MDDLVGKIEDDGSITNKGRYTGWAVFSYDQLLVTNYVNPVMANKLRINGIN